jgi:hypothetical protein
MQSISYFVRRRRTSSNSSSAVPTERQHRDERYVVPWQLSLAIGIGVIVLITYAAAREKERVATFVILFMLSGAAFLIGCLVGFLFGIPKSRTDGSSRIPESREAAERDAERYSDNANLEEVSDWLTKIIVGLGLAEFAKFTGFLGFIGESTRAVLGDPGVLVLQGSILFFMVLGFIFCYLWTRVGFYGILHGERARRIFREQLQSEINTIETRTEKEVQENQILNDFMLLSTLISEENTEPEIGALFDYSVQRQMKFSILIRSIAKQPS